MRTQNNTLRNRSKEFFLIRLDQLVIGVPMGDLSKKQEQAIARSTMYLVAAVLSILMIFIAGLFLSAELKQQTPQKAETSQQIARQPEIAPSAQRTWALWRMLGSAMLPAKRQSLS